MIQVQMNLQDPDSPSLQAHLGCEIPGLGPGKRDPGGQEAWARGLLGSLGVCKAGSPQDSLLIPPEPVSCLPGGVSNLKGVFDGRENAGKG